MAKKNDFQKKYPFAFNPNIVELDVLIFNLKTLAQHPSSKFRVSSEGYLKRMGVFKRIKAALFTITYRTPTRRAVRAKLKETIQALYDALQKDETGRLTQGNQRALALFFLNSISKIPYRLYDRQMPEALRAELLKYMHNLRHPHIDSKRINHPEELKDSEIFLSYLLNCYDISEGGSNDAFVLKEIPTKEKNSSAEKRNTLSIFKPSDYEQCSPNNPRFSQRLKRWLSLSFGRYFAYGMMRLCDGKSYLAETATSELYQNYIHKLLAESGIDHSIIPKSSILSGTAPSKNETGILSRLGKKDRPNEKIGSSQQWVERVQGNLEKFLKVDNKFNSKSKKENDEITTAAIQKIRLQFEVLTIVDMVTGNVDRHGENGLVGEKDDKTLLYGIDNGASFPIGHPTSRDLLMQRNLYVWKNLKWCKENTYSDTAKLIIKNIYDKRQAIANKLYHHFSRHENSADTLLRIQAMLERITVLYHTSQEEPTTISKLASVRLEHHFNKWFKEHPEQIIRFVPGVCSPSNPLLQKDGADILEPLPILAANGPAGNGDKKIRAKDFECAVLTKRRHSWGGFSCKPV